MLCFRPQQFRVPLAAEAAAGRPNLGSVGSEAGAPSMMKRTWRPALTAFGICVFAAACGSNPKPHTPPVPAPVAQPPASSPAPAPTPVVDPIAGLIKTSQDLFDKGEREL